MAIKSASGYPQLSGSLVTPLFATAKKKNKSKATKRLKKPLKKRK